MTIERRMLLAGAGSVIAAGSVWASGSDMTSPSLSTLSTNWLPIETGVDLSNHVAVGALRLVVRNFDAKKPIRVVTRHGVDVVKKEETGSGTSQSQPDKNGKKTRWHIDATKLFTTTNQKEMVLVKIRLDDPDLAFNLSVPGGFPVALADNSAPQAFANPEMKANNRAAVFWVVREANATSEEVDTGLNIALLVADKAAGGSEFELPIIIDPMVRNRG